jgi:RimJ/RimL family protein N-acetyltransferase
MSHPLLVRRVTQDDFDALLAMKSDPEDIKWSGFASPPNPKKFRDWFTGHLDDPKRLMLMGLIDGDPAGYAHFLREADSVLYDISYGIAPAHRGKGLGTELLIESTQQLIATGMPSPAFQTWVAVTNIGSNKACAKAGFVDSGQVKDQEFLYPERRIEQMRLWVTTPR